VSEASEHCTTRLSSSCGKATVVTDTSSPTATLAWAAAAPCGRDLPAGWSTDDSRIPQGFPRPDRSDWRSPQLAHRHIEGFTIRTLRLAVWVAHSDDSRDFRESGSPISYSLGGETNRAKVNKEQMTPQGRFRVVVNGFRANQQTYDYMRGLQMLGCINRGHVDVN